MLGKRQIITALIIMAFACIPKWAQAEVFTCEDGAGGKVMCIPQREANLLRISCKRGSLFEVKWVCTAFPETSTTLCRSKDGQRMLRLADYDDDRFLCSSVCFCPLPDK